METEMLGVKGGTEAVVREWGTGAEKYLCAYYISESGITEDAIRSHLFMKLPAYMVPGQYVRMQAMPMTLSGKINRKALEEPRAPEHGIPVAAIDMTDMTPEEKKMARVWSRVLKKGGIGPQSRFIDMGGDSLGCYQNTDSRAAVWLDAAVS
jgi:hypothetical protein